MSMNPPLYIITTAYNALDYFDRYIESLYSEVSTLSFETHVYIAIDNCQDTLYKAKIWKNNNKHIKNINIFYSNKNVGTYILKNSLLKRIQDENSIILFFDIDDIIIHGFLTPYYSKSIEYFKNSKNFIIRAMHYNISEDLISSIYKNHSEIELSKRIIYTLINKNEYYNLVIYILTILKLKNFYNKNLITEDVYKKNVIKIINNLKVANTYNGSIASEIISDNYKSVNNICNSLIYALKLLALSKNDSEFVRKKRYLPTPGCGSFFTSLSCLKKLGMFNKYRVEQDNDILMRANLNNISIIIDETLPFFIRSVSKTALTQDKKTGYYSQYRKKIRAVNRNLIERNHLIAPGKSCQLQKIN